MNLIELKDISKNYKMDKVIVKAVDKASFSIKKGEFAAISGSSGSGKSTLLNIIGLIDLPTSGSLLLNGNDIYAQTKLSADTKLSAVLDKKLTVLRRKTSDLFFRHSI